MKKLLIGGSPCTYWSIAQNPENRETTAQGLGWELFKNFLIARDKFEPDFFLYENNKSMSREIRAQITTEFGFEPILINSALVSAQNRQRLYWVGHREPDGTYTRIDIEQPEDRGILLRDVLETGQDLTSNPKSYAVTTRCNGAIPSDTICKHRHNMVAEPACLRYERTDLGKKLRKQYESGEIKHGFNECKELHPRTDGKTNTVSTITKDNMIAEPLFVGCMPSPDGTIKRQQATSATKPDTYTVLNGQIDVKGKLYPIALLDGEYVIRKLTVTECARLQTIPEWYTFPSSNSQAYKMLGNGWTVEVIKHLLSHMDGITENELNVLSMYDGMSCGRIALKELGADVTCYKATEIDKYAIQAACHNFPDIVQLGDAFAVRNDDWRYSGE